MSDRHQDDGKSRRAETADGRAEPEHVAAAARQISETFLGAHPGRYFRTRAIRWAANGAQPIDRGQLAWPATEVGEQVRERLGEVNFVDGRPTDDQAASTLDAFMLAHHAGESLMRHFLALLSATTNPHPVPWLEMVSLQDGREFRRRLKVIIDASNEDLDEVIEVLLVPPELAAAIPNRTRGIDADASMRPVDAAEGSTDWGEDPLGAVHAYCRAWLRHFGRKFLDEGSGYNAAKHGLSTVTGFSQVAVHPDPEAWDGPGPVPAPYVMFEGPEIRTVEHNGAKGEARRWFTVTRYVDPPGLIAHTLIAADLLDWLWEIERARKLQLPAEIAVRAGPLPRDVIDGHARTWGELRVPLGALPLPDPVRDDILRRLGVVDANQDQDPT